MCTKLKLVGLASLLLFQSGCWDRIEVNDLAFVGASGYDKLEENSFRISVQIPLPGAMGGATGGGGGTSGSKPYYIDSGVGRNVRESNNDLQQRMSRRLYFAHRRVVIFGEKLARSGFKKSLDVIQQQPQSRLSTFALITDGEALDILNSSPHLEQSPSEAIREITKAGIAVDVKDVLMDINRPGKDPILPVVAKVKTQNMNSQEQQDEIEIKDMGIFKDDQLMFITNMKETQGVRWILNKQKGKPLTVPVRENGEINLRIIEAKYNIDYSVKNDRPSFEFNIRATGQLMQNEPNLDLEDPKVYDMVKLNMQKEIKGHINAIFDRTKAEGIDSFGLGWQIYRTNKQFWNSKLEEDWREIIKEVPVLVKVDADVQRLTNTGIKAKD